MIFVRSTLDPKGNRAPLADTPGMRTQLHAHKVWIDDEWPSGDECASGVPRDRSGDARTLSRLRQRHARMSWRDVRAGVEPEGFPSKRAFIAHFARWSIAQENKVRRGQYARHSPASPVGWRLSSRMRPARAPSRSASLHRDMKPHQLSLAHLTLPDASPIQLVDGARAGGFDCIGLRVVAPYLTTLAFPLISNEAAIRALISKLADNDIRVFDVEAFWIRPDTDVAAWEPALELAARLGAKQVLAMGDDYQRSRLITRFVQLAELAEKYSLGVGLEFLPYVQVGAIVDASRLISAANRPNTGVVIDALHLHRSGGTPELIASLDERLISYGQLCDARGPKPLDADGLRREARSGRFFPGQGELPLHKFVSAIPRGLPFAVEAPCETLAHLSIEARGRLCGEQTRQLLAECDQGVGRRYQAVTNQGVGT